MEEEMLVHVCEVKMSVWEKGITDKVKGDHSHERL